jgi:hypothetical protein
MRFSKKPRGGYECCQGRTDGVAWLVSGWDQDTIADMLRSMLTQRDAKHGREQGHTTKRQFGTLKGFF